MKFPVFNRRELIECLAQHGKNITLTVKPAKPPTYDKYVSQTRYNNILTELTDKQYRKVSLENSWGLVAKYNFIKTITKNKKILAMIDEELKALSTTYIIS